MLSLFFFLIVTKETIILSISNMAFAIDMSGADFVWNFMRLNMRFLLFSKKLSVTQKPYFCLRPPPHLSCLLTLLFVPPYPCLSCLLTRTILPSYPPNPTSSPSPSCLLALIIVYLYLYHNASTHSLLGSLSSLKCEFMEA